MKVLYKTTTGFWSVFLWLVIFEIYKFRLKLKKIWEKLQKVLSTSAKSWIIMRNIGADLEKKLLKLNCYNFWMNAREKILSTHKFSKVGKFIWN